jgi:hypothetical protein
MMSHYRHSVGHNIATFDQFSALPLNTYVNWDAWLFRSVRSSRCFGESYWFQLSRHSTMQDNSKQFSKRPELDVHTHRPKHHISVRCRVATNTATHFIYSQWQVLAEPIY